jgi:hypothetical protein
VSDPLKILMLGHCFSVFIDPLVAELKRRRELAVSILELLDSGSETRGVRNSVYDRVLKHPKLGHASSKATKLNELTRHIFRKGGSGELFLLMKDIVRYGIRSAARNAFAKLNVTDAWHSLLGEYDLCHFHYLDLALSEPVSYLPPDVPVVLSIWGSDLMDTAGTDVYSTHMSICERADIITVRSLAMREIFLSKFGRRFLPKIRLAKLAGRLSDVIDTLPKEASRAAFCAKHDIDPAKRIVCLGHSGWPRDRHVQLLKSIASSPATVKESVTFVLPMTYGASSDYLRQTSSAARETGLDVHILTEFMSLEEVGMMRLASDIMVFLPEQDALSAAMCETIYAGNAVITGAWLPYMELWDRQIELFRIEDIGELPHMLASVLRDFESIARGLSHNRTKIRSLMDYKYVIDEWLSAYDAALAARLRR